MISLNVLNREEGTLKPQNLQTFEYTFSKNIKYLQLEKSKRNIYLPALAKRKDYQGSSEFSFEKYLCNLFYFFLANSNITHS